MDKIDRKDYRMYLNTAPLIVDMLDKFDELVEFVNGLQKVAEKQETVK